MPTAPISVSFAKGHSMVHAVCFMILKASLFTIAANIVTGNFVVVLKYLPGSQHSKAHPPNLPASHLWL
jgi:hypothetical protein